jgi:hypothetical protein
MRRNSGKTPRVPAAAAAAAAGPEDAAAEASEVPLGQPFTDGDDDDSGARASRTDTSFPRADDEIDAEAAAALLTDLEGAAVDEAGDKEEDEDSSNSEEEEDKVAPGSPLATSESDNEGVQKTPKKSVKKVPEVKGKGKARAAAAAGPRRSSARVKEIHGRPKDTPPVVLAAASDDELEFGDGAAGDGAASSPNASGPGGALAVLAEQGAAAAAGPSAAARVEKKHEHKSGVWVLTTPTGFPVDRARTALMDHTEGKEWEVVVWNHLVEPTPPNDEIDHTYVPRCYEQRNRALMTVVHLGKMKDDDLLDIVEPHDRLCITGFHSPKNEFKGTLLSCVDLVYCPSSHLATPYCEWRGTLNTSPERNTKRFISEICAGYYVKLNSNSSPMDEKTSWAVLYAFRPWGSSFGEPQVACMEMEDGEMVKDAPVKNVNAADIVAVGGLTNSLCKAVNKWLTDNMPCFKSIRTEEQLAKPNTARSEADVGRALEESLGVLDTKKVRERYLANMRAYADELIANERCLIVIREGQNFKWTKVEEGKEDEEMLATINKETTAFDEWWVRQLLRAHETICYLVEFGPKTNQFNDVGRTLTYMKGYQTLMTLHEEEILTHLATLNYDNADVAKAYQLMNINTAVHKLNDKGSLDDPVYVPVMFADIFVSMITQITADDPSAQLKERTAWVPKQVRLTYKKAMEYYKHKNPEPDWVKDALAKRAEEVAALQDLDEDEKTAAAFRKIGMRGKPAPGDPGGLGGSKPMQQKTKTFDPKKRGFNENMLPPKWLDDPDNFVDGKTNKTRLVGTFARFPTGSEGRTQKQLHRWCVCDTSKGKANKDTAFYPGHFVSTQNSSSAAHPNQGKDGCSFNNFTPDPDKDKPSSAKGKAKGDAGAAPSSASSTVAEADLKRAKIFISNLQNQLRTLTASRDAEHLKCAKATELANTQLSLQAKATNELISAHAKTLRTSQLETFKAIAKINEIRGHAENFAENMLAKATQDKPVDMDAAWAAFSGVLTSETIDAADWGDGIPKKKLGPRSVNVFNIDAFQGASAAAAAPPTPIQHAVYQLNDVKVNGHPTPDGYEVPVGHAQMLLKWTTATGKRKRGGDSDSDSVAEDDEVIDEDDEDDA